MKLTKAEMKTLEKLRNNEKGFMFLTPDEQELLRKIGDHLKKLTSYNVWISYYGAPCPNYIFRPDPDWKPEVEDEYEEVKIYLRVKLEAFSLYAFDDLDDTSREYIFAPAMKGFSGYKWEDGTISLNPRWPKCDEVPVCWLRRKE